MSLPRSQDETETHIIGCGVRDCIYVWRTITATKEMFKKAVYRFTCAHCGAFNVIEHKKHHKRR